jgi:hypothetical protein
MSSDYGYSDHCGCLMSFDHMFDLMYDEFNSLFAVMSFDHVLLSQVDSAVTFFSVILRTLTI